MRLALVCPTPVVVQGFLDGLGEELAVEAEPLLHVDPVTELLPLAGSPRRARHHVEAAGGGQVGGERELLGHQLVVRGCGGRLRHARRGRRLPALRAGDAAAQAAVLPAVRLRPDAAPAAVGDLSRHDHREDGGDRRRGDPGEGASLAALGRLSFARSRAPGAAAVAPLASGASGRGGGRRRRGGGLGAEGVEIVERVDELASRARGRRRSVHRRAGPARGHRAAGSALPVAVALLGTPAAAGFALFGVTAADLRDTAGRGAVAGRRVLGSRAVPGAPAAVVTRHGPRPVLARTGRYGAAGSGRPVRAALRALGYGPFAAVSSHAPDQPLV